MSKDPAKRAASEVIRQASQTKAEIDAAIKKGQKTTGDINIDDHVLSEEECLKKHGTNRETGLSDSDVASKLKVYGRNELTPPPKTPMWLLFVQQLTGFFSLLLWAAAILCFVGYGLDPLQVENLYLGIVLAAVVLITGIFSFYQDYSSAEIMNSFKNFLPENTNVRRNGKSFDTPSATLVPGDIVMMKTGAKIPADVRVLSASNLKVDNSSLTGESEAQKRKPENKEANVMEATNIIFMGTMIVEGNCEGVVVGTGDKTLIGTIAGLAANTEAIETPISIEIKHFIHVISAVALFLGVSFLIIGIVKGTPYIQNLVFMIGIIVANVPEGLLATVTVSLTLTAKRMAQKKVLVKNLEAVETLGSTTVIASDKTGTLTQNRMTVAHVYYDSRSFLAHGKGPESFNPDSKSLQLLVKVGTLCNNATFINGKVGPAGKEVENMSLDVLQRVTTGDASESAFIKFCEPICPRLIKTGKQVDGAGAIINVRNENVVLAKVPFNSANKFQVSIHLQDSDWDKPRLMCMKGAPERVYNRCDRMIVDGKVVKITPEITKIYEEAMRVLMSGGERILGCCMAELDPKKFNNEYVYQVDEKPYNIPMGLGDQKDGEQGGLIFVGLMALIDPPRAAVPRAVLDCQKAGIKVVMVTGDHPDTAEAIAKQVNIIRDCTRRDIAFKLNCPIEDVPTSHHDIQAVVVTGAELENFTPEQLDDVLDYDQIVFARTSPVQKYIIVTGLQNKKFIKRGFIDPKPVHHVVAVTGDGVNDSVALRAADIGVAMGIAGTDVAKDAADMILLNDNFASIVDGVEEGRLIFDNLKKSIAYTLSSNIPEISPFLAYILISIPLPLPTVLILCIDLGTDMVPAISLAYENKEANIMKKPPRDMNTERLVTAKLVHFSYLQIGVVQALAGFYVYVCVLYDYGFAPWILPGFAGAFTRSGSAKIPNYIIQRMPGTNQPIGITMAEPGNKLFGETRELVECSITGHPVCYDPVEALAHAQGAFFISIVIVQWADLVACKTRTLSLQTQGMRNGMLTFGLFFETVLGVILCYVEPLNMPLGTRPLVFVHWLPALPFCILILVYDEIRKWLLRSLGKNNWVERNTYY